MRSDTSGNNTGSGTLLLERYIPLLERYIPFDVSQSTNRNLYVSICLPGIGTLIDKCNQTRFLERPYHVVKFY